MSDLEFLTKVIELHQLIYTNDAILLIDLENTILFAGEEIKNIVDISPNTLVGKNHFEVLPLPKENLDSIIKSLNSAIKFKKTQEFLSINLNHNNEYIILHCIEKPIINPTTQNVIAISIESKKLAFQIYLYKFLLFLEEEQIQPTILKHTDPLLTLREHEIAFLLFYCKTAKKISQILGQVHNKVISAKTINNIISNKLYSKLNVYGIEALLDKLNKLNYHTKIPISFLNNMFLNLN